MKSEVGLTIWRVHDARRLRYASRTRATRIPAARHVIPRWVGSCQEVTGRATIAANPSGCTYRRTRASPPLWRMRTRDTRERSSYHRLALRRRLYPTAKSTSPIRRMCPRKTRRATRTDLPRGTSMLRSATFDSTLLHEKWHDRWRANARQ